MSKELKVNLYEFLDSLHPDTVVVINGLVLSIGMAFGTVEDTTEYTTENDGEFVIINTNTWG